MARRRRAALLTPRHARLEIVPMIDIMMFLLIFFVMITLRMIPNAGVPMLLPGAATAATLPPSHIVIALDFAGQAHVRGTTLTLDALQAELTAMGQGRKLGVVIAADRGASLQDVMRVMDAVRRAGVNEVGLATKPD